MFYITSTREMLNAYTHICVVVNITLDAYILISLHCMQVEIIGSVRDGGVLEDMGHCANNEQTLSQKATGHKRLSMLSIT